MAQLVDDDMVDAIHRRDQEFGIQKDSAGGL